MQHAAGVILGLILVLFHLIVSAIAIIEGALRSVLAPMGLGHDTQNAILLVFAVLLVVAAIRLFGGVFAMLLIILLAVMALHILVPALGTPQHV